MTTPPGRRRPAPADRPDHWTLQDAKVRLSEVVRRARTEGPQRVTVRGQEAAVLLSPEEFRRLKGWQTGQALIDALQASPHPEIDLESPVGEMQRFCPDNTSAVTNARHAPAARP